MASLTRIVAVAQDLVSDERARTPDGEPVSEYDRALVELVANLMPPDDASGANQAWATAQILG